MRSVVFQRHRPGTQPRGACHHGSVANLLGLRAEPPLFGDRMCEPCLRARTVLAKVPENVPWVRCARCGIVEIDGKWENTTEAEVWDELLHRNLVVHERAEDIQLGMEPVKVSDRHTLLHIQLEGVIDDLLFQEEHTMRARMANGVCLTCTRRAGNYFEATVQLRSSARRLSEDEFNRLRATLDDVLDKLSDDPMFFITNEGPRPAATTSCWGAKGSPVHGGDTSSTNTAAWSWRPIQRSAGKTAWT